MIARPFTWRLLVEVVIHVATYKQINIIDDNMELRRPWEAAWLLLLLLLLWFCCCCLLLLLLLKPNRAELI